MHPLVSTIIEQLENQLTTAVKASHEAHASAIHSENIADNKYDTLGLEAAYLAHGQSVRILELQNSIALYRRFQIPSFTHTSTIQTGALVTIESQTGDIQRLFIGPCAGGLIIATNEHPIRVTTTAAPLGQALLNKAISDEFEISVNQCKQYFTILDIR